MTKPNLFYFGIFLFIALISAILINSFAFNAMHPRGISSDEVRYNNIAVSLVKNFKYPEIVNQVRPPAYPAFLATIYFFFSENYQTVTFIQFILLGVIGFSLFLIAKNYLNLPTLWSLSIGIIVMFWPYMILYSSLLLSELLFIFFLTLSFYYILKLFKEVNRKNTLILGILLGLATLTRPVALLLPVFIIIL